MVVPGGTAQYLLLVSFNARLEAHFLPRIPCRYQNLVFVYFSKFGAGIFSCKYFLLYSKRALFQCWCCNCSEQLSGDVIRVNYLALASFRLTPASGSHSSYQTGLRVNVLQKHK